MGIYDREYYRDESRGFGLFNGVAPGTKALILANVAVFLARWLMPDAAFGEWLTAGSTEILGQGRIWQLVTASFYHDAPLSILFNMLILWFVGRELESIYGTREFVLFYLAAAVLGTLAWAGLDYTSSQAGLGRLYGSSGAIAAAFVVFAMYYPNREILLFFVLPVPMWLAAALYFGYDIIMLTQQPRGASGPFLAVVAHLVGGGYGILYKLYDLRWSRLTRPPRFRPRLKVVRPEPRDPVTPLPAGTGRSAAGGAGMRPSGSIDPPEHLDERLDEVLAKIAREGRAGLTEEENLILQEASRRARRRRSDRV